MPITLRNINSNLDIGGISRALTAARQGIQGSLGGLQKTFSGIETGRDDDALKNFQNSLAGLDTQQLGDVNINDIAAGNARLDTTQLQNLLTKQIGTVRGQETDNFNFGETQRKQAEVPLIAEANKFVTSGDTAGLANFLANNNIQDPSQLTRGAQSSADANVQRGRNNTTFNRSEQAFARSEDARKDQEAIRSFVSKQGIQNQIATEDIRKQQQTFADNTNGVSFNADGSMNIDPTIDPITAAGIQQDFAQLSSGFPKVLSENDIVKGVQNISNQTQADLGVTNDAIRSVRESEQIRTQLSTADQGKLAAVDEAATQAFNLEQAQADNALRFAEESTPVNPVVTAQQEAVKPSAVFTQLDSLISTANSNGNDLGDNLDDDGSELKEIKTKMGNVHKLGFPSPTGSGKNIPYPNWVKEEAIKSTGIIGVFQPGITGDTTDVTTYKNKLNEIMALHVQSIDNRRSLADGRAKHLQESNARRLKLNNALGKNLKSAKNSSGVFDQNNANAATLQSAIDSLQINR